MRIFITTKHQSGHLHSSWGRTSEDEDTIVWVVGEFSILSDNSQTTIYTLTHRILQHTA
jgi:hypothetical protein